MKAMPLSLALALWTIAAAPSAGGAELKGGRIVVTVKKDGCGFIDAVTFRGRQGVKAPAGFVGGRVVLTAPGDGTAESLFSNAATAVLTAAIDEIRTSKHAVAVKGGYTNGKVRAAFTRRIALAADKDAITVTEEADFRALDARYAVAKHQLHLPLVLHRDPHLRMLGFGCAHRAELFRMDMNDVNRGGKQLISAPRGHRPYWDIGGVLQLPRSYRVWKANHADTMAYPLDEGVGAPGWADYSEPQWGITAVVIDPGKSAPWAMTIDARKGAFTIAPFPASQIAVSAADYGKRVFRFRLMLHETSWPATHPCELDLKLYRALLEDMSTSGGRPVPWVLYRPVGTADIDTIIHRQRIQPSVMLRTLYRGDAYRMQGRMRTLGIQRPRNQPMGKWEIDAKAYLDHLRKGGLPKPRGR